MCARDEFGFAPGLLHVADGLNRQPIADAVVLDASRWKRITSWAELFTLGGPRIDRQGRREDVDSSSLRYWLILVGAVTRRVLRQLGTGYPRNGNLLKTALSLDP